jgi:hypothetical protein
MARLLTHLTRELESEVVRAVEESNDGYPQHLDDLRASYEQITDEDIDAVSEALWEGQCEGRDCGREEAQWDAHVAAQQRMHDEQLDGEAEEAEYRAYEREG